MVSVDYDTRRRRGAIFFFRGDCCRKLCLARFKDSCKISLEFMNGLLQGFLADPLLAVFSRNPPGEIFKVFIIIYSKYILRLLTTFFVGSFLTLPYHYSRQIIDYVSYDSL